MDAKEARRSRWFFLGILAALVLFFAEVFLLRVSFLSGDHRAQHYSWAVILAEQVKMLRLPWWTSLFHCGFPLLAEGQIGALYPVNLLFYFLFPVYPAYTYNILFHYVLSALFFFAFLRSMRLHLWAVVFGTLIYLFGTAQGGYFYNIISLKVLTWFPLTLLLAYRILHRNVYRETAWLAVVFALQLCAGYLQYAVYSVGFSVFFFVWFALAQWRETRNSRDLLVKASCLGAALFLAGLVALPQLGSTFELSLFSNRYKFPDEFAYVGSLNPMAIVTLYFPHWDGFLRAELYAGTIGLFFFLISLLTSKDKNELFFLAMMALAVLLALGQFNPLYVLFVKLTHFTSFRIPVKFLYFAAFSMAVLCAQGFHKWQDPDARRKAGLDAPYRVFQGLSVLAVLGFLAAKPFLTHFEQPIKSLIQRFMTATFTHSVVHTLPLDVYFSRLDAFYNAVVKMMAPSDIWNLGFASFTLGAMILAWFLRRSGWRATGALKFGILVFTFANLYLYSWTTVKGNYETLGFIQRPSRIVDYLKGHSGAFRVHRVISEIGKTENFPLPPHTNVIDSLSIIGGYSPLVLADYYELLEGLGDIDDSNRFLTATVKSIAEKKTFLDFLNVRYLISDLALEDISFSEVLQDGGYALYENRQYLPRAFWVPNSRNAGTFKEFLSIVREGRFEPSRYAYLASGAGEERSFSDTPIVPARILADSGMEAEVFVSAPHRGYLVMSDLFYPGWHAYRDGREVPLLKANGSFRAIEIEKPGPCLIKFQYRPVWEKIAFFSAALALLLLCIPMFRSNPLPAEQGG